MARLQAAAARIGMGAGRWRAPYAYGYGNDTKRSEAGRGGGNAATGWRLGEQVYVRLLCDRERRIAYPAVWVTTHRVTDIGRTQRLRHVFMSYHEIVVKSGCGGKTIEYSLGSKL